MRQFVESLRRLYVCRILLSEKVEELFLENKITYDEKQYILADK